MATNIDNIMKEYLKSGEDFGFTTSDDTSSELEKKDLTIAQYKERMKQVEELIMPLLANLHDTADKPTIHWPNRRPEIEKKIKELLALTRS